jgi:hypothetical protein
VAAPLTVLSPGTGVAGTPSRGNGNEGLKRLSRFRRSGVCRQPVPPGMPVVGAQVAADGSRWQFLGKSPPPSRRARRNRQRNLGLAQTGSHSVRRRGGQFGLRARCVGMAKSVAWVVDSLPVALAGGVRWSHRMSSTRHRGPARRTAPATPAGGPEARRSMATIYTVLCFGNFVNATISKGADSWTEELDRLGDKNFLGIQKLYDYARRARGENRNRTATASRQRSMASCISEFGSTHL